MTTPRTGFRKNFTGRELFEFCLREKHPDFINTKLTGVLLGLDQGWVNTVIRTGDDEFDYYAFPNESLISMHATNERVTVNGRE